MFSCVFVTFPYCVLFQVWYLIVSTPDLPFLSTLKRHILSNDDDYSIVLDCSMLTDSDKEL